MGLPSINISFKEIASNAIKRGERGIVALVLEDDAKKGKFDIIHDKADIPVDAKAENKKQIEFALKGYINTPNKIIVAYTDGTLTDALAVLEPLKFDIMAVASAESKIESADVVEWVKKRRADGRPVMAVLSNTSADSPDVVNYTTESVTVGGTKYTAEQFCSRIAGLIAGTPLSMSCTFAPLTDVTECTLLGKKALDSAIEAGDFVLYNDGEKIKVARGVTSFTSFTAEKGKQYGKIKIVNVMNIIHDDIKRTAEDMYLGKFANSYDNKCLLVGAIGDYFDQLVLEGILSSANVDIDVVAQRAYLKQKGVDVNALSDMEIKQANTDDKVFLSAKISILDAIEEIELPITI